jgi:hypothetical protein
MDHASRSIRKSNEDGRDAMPVGDLGFDLLESQTEAERRRRYCVWCVTLPELPVKLVLPP